MPNQPLVGTDDYVSVRLSVKVATTATRVVKRIEFDCERRTELISVNHDCLNTGRLPAIIYLHSLEPRPWGARLPNEQDEMSLLDIDILKMYLVKKSVNIYTNCEKSFAGAMQNLGRYRHSSLRCHAICVPLPSEGYDGDVIRIAWRNRKHGLHSLQFCNSDSAE